MVLHQITSDFILNFIFCFTLFGGLNEFDRVQSAKAKCPSYCGVEHYHNFGLPTGIVPSNQLKSKDPIYIAVTAKKKP